MKKVRVRFAPSPTGPLHIGGLRTALYNYLFAKKAKGDFLLRVEDTDQKRYVEGAEDYIRRALEWSGIQIDEGPGPGGPFGPYRQSERKEIYATHITRLIASGDAYYAFDTAEEIEAWRQQMTDQGVHSPKYDHATRSSMRNSLTLPMAEVQQLILNDAPYTIRLKVEPGQKIAFEDIIRGQVEFNSDELDDKVLMKSDGLPTYHLANVVDDHTMEISHVIRGEEWLSSTAHHVLLYRAFGWETDMPQFAHLPLLLKPTGKGKLSKRDGQKLGIPVFPMDWASEEGLYPGFKEMGFLPEAMINFLAFLGWNPGTEQELFSMRALTDAFSLDNVSKGGARFDFDKAKWFNQQYIQTVDAQVLVEALANQLNAKNINKSDAFLSAYVELFRPRVTLLNDLFEEGYYFFEDINTFNVKMLKKKWKDEAVSVFHSITQMIDDAEDWTADALKSVVELGIEKLDSSYGQLLPLIRIALSGDVKGPDIFMTMTLLGRDVTMQRLQEAPELFSKLISEE